MRIRDKQLRRTIDSIQESGRSIGKDELLQLLIGVADGSRMTPAQADASLRDPSLSQQQRLGLAREGMSNKEKTDIKLLLASSIEIEPDIRAVLQALVGESSQPVEESTLDRLALELSQDGALSAEDIRNLLDSAFSDGPLSTNQSQNLKRIGNRYRDQMVEGDRKKLSALLGMPSPTIQQETHNLAKDGVIDLKDARRLGKLAAEGGFAENDVLSLQAVQFVQLTTLNAASHLDVTSGAFGDAGEDFLFELDYYGTPLSDAPAELQTNKSFLIAAIQESPNIFHQVEESIRSDPQFQLAALRANGKVIKDLPSPVEDREILKLALKTYPGALENGTEELRNDLELAKLAISTGPGAVAHLGPELSGDKELATFALNLWPSEFAQLPEDFRADRELALLAVSGQGRMLKYASDDLRDDLEVVSVAVGEDCHAYSSASVRLRGEEVIAELALTGDGRLLKHAPEGIRNRVDMLQTAVTSSGRALEFVDLDALSSDDAKMLVTAAIGNTGSALQHAGRFKDDPDIVIEAVKNNGLAIEFAGESCRENPQIAELAVSQNGRAYRLLSPAMKSEPKVGLAAVRSGHSPRSLGFPDSLFADRDFAIEAVKADEDLFPKVPFHMYDDPAFIFGVVQTYPDIMCDVGEELGTDREFVSQALDKTGAAFAYLRDEFRDDDEFFNKAVADTPKYVYRYASERLRSDPDIARDMIKIYGQALLEAEPELHRNIPLVLEAVQRNPHVYSRLPQEIRQRPDVILETMANYPYLIPTTFSNQMSDPDVVEKLAEANPVALDHVPSGVRRRLFRSRPDIERNYQQAKQDLKALDIAFTRRIGSFDNVQEIIANRTQPRDPGDTRPTALLVFPTADHNGAFLASPNIKNLLEDYRVLYYEADTDIELKNALDESALREPAQLVVVAGHGNPRQVALGERNGSEVRNFDFSDEEQFQGSFARAVEDGGVIMLESCSTGKGREAEKNVANMLHRLAPQAHVYAPTEDTNSSILFDEDGMFRSPGYTMGRSETYHVPPQ